jgi:hypothetical protein
VRLTRQRQAVVKAVPGGRLEFDGQIVDVTKEDGGYEDNAGGSGPGGAHMKFAGRLLARVDRLRHPWPAFTVELEVKDAATARRVGRSLIHRRAYQRRRVTVLLSDYADVTVGEVYDLVMPTFSINRNAVLTSLRGVVGRLATFTVLDGPL